MSQPSLFPVAAWILATVVAPGAVAGDASKDWTLVGSGSQSAVFMRLSPEVAGDLRRFTLAVYVFSDVGDAEMAKYRRTWVTLSIDCKTQQLSFETTRAERVDGRMEAVPPQAQPLAPPADPGQKAMLALGCGQVKPEAVASLRTWEGTVASSVRQDGQPVRDDPGLTERCAVLYERKAPASSPDIRYDIYITPELAFRAISPRAAFAAYVRNKVGGPVPESWMHCAPVDADQSESQAAWIERVLGADSHAGRVVDDRWRP